VFFGVLMERKFARVLWPLLNFLRDRENEKKKKKKKPPRVSDCLFVRARARTHARVKRTSERRRKEKGERERGGIRDIKRERERWR